MKREKAVVTINNYDPKSLIMENSKIAELLSVIKDKTEWRYEALWSYGIDSRRVVKSLDVKYYDGFEEDVKKYGVGLTHNPICGLPIHPDTPNWGESFIDLDNLEYLNILNIDTNIEARVWLVSRNFENLGEIPFNREYAEQLGRIISESDFKCWCPTAYNEAVQFITNESEFVFISFFGWNKRPKELRDQLVTMICLINPKK